MTRMAVIAHGGAGADPKKATNIQSAVDVGGSKLTQGASALEVAVMVCAALEDDPSFNAGTGSVTRVDGSVLVDASVQTGDGRNRPFPAAMSVITSRMINGVGLGYGIEPSPRAVRAIPTNINDATSNFSDSFLIRPP